METISSGKTEITIIYFFKSQTTKNTKNPKQHEIRKSWVFFNMCCKSALLGSCLCSYCEKCISQSFTTMYFCVCCWPLLQCTTMYVVGLYYNILLCMLLAFTTMYYYACCCWPLLQYTTMYVVGLYYNILLCMLLAITAMYFYVCCRPLLQCMLLAFTIIYYYVCCWLLLQCTSMYVVGLYYNALLCLFV